MGKKAAKVRLARRSLMKYDLDKIDRQQQVEERRLAEVAEELGIPRSED